MLINDLQKQNNRLIQFIFSLFYVFNCISYLISFIAIFIFIFLLASFGQETIHFFDPLLTIIVIVQIIQLIVYGIVYPKNWFLFAEILRTALIVGLYSIHQVITQLQYLYPFPIINHLQVTINFIFYAAYLVILRPRISQFFEKISFNFYNSFTLGFIFLIVMGTWLLSLPYSRTHFIPLIDLCLTSTAAVTVTGITSININNDLTFFGQCVIILLMQIGGIGMITFSAFFLISIKQKTNYENRLNTLNVFNQNETTGLKNLLIMILSSTIIIEFLGILLIFQEIKPLSLNWGDRWFTSIFYSVSSFCNAGFSLSIMNQSFLRDTPSILYTISLLVFLGGLGFFVFLELLKRIFFSIKHRGKKRVFFLSLNAKIILWMSCSLVIIGAVGIYFLEKNATFQHLNTWQKINNSIFESVSLRTAGFQTFDISQYTNATLLLCEFLIFIGAAPGSTGGGLRVTTFFILIWGVISIIRKRSNNLTISKYQISPNTFFKAGCILFVRLICIFIGLLTMLISNNEYSFKYSLFEVISLFSGTGLSSGLIVQFSTFSKIVSIFLMFLGKIGVYYFLSNLFKIKTKKTSIQYNQLNLPLE